MARQIQLYALHRDAEPRPFTDLHRKMEIVPWVRWEDVAPALKERDELLVINAALKADMSTNKAEIAALIPLVNSLVLQYKYDRDLRSNIMGKMQLLAVQ